MQQQAVHILLRATFHKLLSVSLSLSLSLPLALYNSFSSLSYAVSLSLSLSLCILISYLVSSAKLFPEFSDQPLLRVQEVPVHCLLQQDALAGAEDLMRDGSENRIAVEFEIRFPSRH